MSTALTVTGQNTLTITEALAELKTLAKRIAQKRSFVMSFLWRQEMIKDPHADDGGTPAVIGRELQAINDLEKRSVALRTGIAAANALERLDIGGRKLSIQEWLIWRREIAPNQKTFLQGVAGNLAGARQEMQRRGLGFPTGEATKPNPTDMVFHVTESEVAKDLEELENILGTLDGLLSLKNATVTITV